MMPIWLHAASEASGDAGTVCAFALGNPCVVTAGIITLVAVGGGLLAWWLSG